MAAPTPTVTAYFTLNDASNLFILDDTTKGLLDGATYVLSGDVATDVTSYVRSVSIRRGRERALDEITVGVAEVETNNYTRIFDPEYAAGTFYGNIKPGKRFVFAANGITIFEGLVDDWNFQYPVSKGSTASFDVVDCLATLGSAEFDAWTTTASQTPGVRLAAILDRSEVLFPATRALDTGTSTLQADNVSWGSNVLNYCQLVAKCDLGQLFASKTGILTFYGRNRSVGTLGSAEFRDDGSGIPYSAIEIDYGTELLFNRVSVDATGFTKQTVTDSTSFASFGSKWYSLSLASLPLETQAQALDLANYLLALYKSPTDRIAQITVNLHALSTSNQNIVLNLDIGSVVRVVNTPNGVSTAIDKYLLIEGMNHLIGPGFHSVTLFFSNLADGFSGQPFTLDDATWGLLDTVGSGLLTF